MTCRAPTRRSFSNGAGSGILGSAAAADGRGLRGQFPPARLLPGCSRRRHEGAERRLPPDDVLPAPLRPSGQRFAREEGCDERPPSPVRPFRHRDPNVSRRDQEPITSAGHCVEVAGPLAPRHEAQGQLQEVRELVWDRIRERWIRRPGGTDSDPRWTPVLLREPEEPRGGGKEVELEVRVLEFREPRQEGEDEVRDGRRVAMRGEPGRQTHRVEGGIPGTLLYRSWRGVTPL